jgi:hypothetical protein
VKGVVLFREKNAIFLGLFIIFSEGFLKNAKDHQKNQEKSRF